MTPREPDRFEAKAKELCLTEWRTIAAALRAEHDDALERAAQWCESQIAGPDTTAQNRWIASRIRALKSPAAAPAAEVKVNACQVDLRTDKDRECFDDIVQAATRVLRSEPAAPEKEAQKAIHRLDTGTRPPRTMCGVAVGNLPTKDRIVLMESPTVTCPACRSPAPLLPRVLAALEGEASFHVPGRLRRTQLDDLAAELRAYIAEREGETRMDPCQRCGKLGGHAVDFRFDGILMGRWICPHCLDAQEKRIAELEAALRDALNAAHHHVQAGQHWICSEPFACEEDCPCAKLAARAATAKEET